ncbi:YbjQ family protein [Glycomyces sp. L485]|uniref:YbjQ family protein n=1 Tax=Glycomyces sp. L485 TaxID=2909235 RepID=UPI001F4B4F80|nr:YbjQ family protein [Glycomyces sp. L485]MCH7231682.1 YbjQ family protein [Glycomyces sp. L485]
MDNIGEFGAANPTAAGFVVVTTENVPGYRVTDTHGEVFGLTVRSRNFFSDFGAGIKSLLGGELKGLTKALAASREEALTRMIDQAKNLGANGVVMMRFDVSDARDLGTEVCAYGTAVTVVRS